MQPVLEYRIPRASTTPSLKGKWSEPAWRDAPVAAIDRYYKQSSDHHPRVEAKLTYSSDRLYVFFRVGDRYVRCRQTNFQGMVCMDSCVEFFIQPGPGRGYFNFEINCGGTLLVYYIENAARTKTGFKKYTPLPWSLGKDVSIFHSLPRVVEPEIAEPAEWMIESSIPLHLFEAYVGPLGKLGGQVWRGNLYKCADESSHPHWASWAPLGAQLNFHQPRYFAAFRFQ